MKIKSKNLSKQFHSWLNKGYPLVSQKDAIERKALEIGLVFKTKNHNSELLSYFKLNIYVTTEQVVKNKEDNIARNKIKEEKDQLRSAERKISKIKKKYRVSSESFYLSIEWVLLTKKVRKVFPGYCMKCGRGGKTHIDHIFPRSIYPELELDIHNLQILCEKCNMDKSNKNTMDYRTIEQKKLLSAKYI
jgi:5-methylcytosine-specific restriction endonuclease McrA